MCQLDMALMGVQGWEQLGTAVSFFVVDFADLEIRNWENERCICRDVDVRTKRCLGNAVMLNAIC